MGRYTDAEPLYRRARGIWEQSFGSNHPKVGTVLENLAALLRKTGRSAEALPLEERAKEIFSKAR
jgi:hypothetical protein